MTDLLKQIDTIHNTLYKKLNKTGKEGAKTLLPIVLAIVSKHKESILKGEAKSTKDITHDILQGDTKYKIEQELQRIINNHPNPSDRLLNTLRSYIHTVNEIPDSKLHDVINKIYENDFFLSSLQSEDVLGVIFESMVGPLFRGDSGQFFTPKNIILTMRETIYALEIKKHKKDFQKFLVCDPCCGSARFLVYWLSKIKEALRKKGLSDKDVEKEIYNYAKKSLFGIDLEPEIASVACVNMLMNGDGSTNIYNADSLNHYGIFANFPLLEILKSEFDAKWAELLILVRESAESQDKINFIEENKDSLKVIDKDVAIDVNTKEARNLIKIITYLQELAKQRTEDFIWESLEKLGKTLEANSVSNILHEEWAKTNKDVLKGFDIIMTNPPFGRDKDLQEDNPYILCQYKLATELWIHDATLEFLRKIIRKNNLDLERGDKSIRELQEDIKKALGKEWLTVEDIEDYDYKITLTEEVVGNTHNIYFKDGEPIIFKKNLAKQILFVEEFLRLVKSSGKVFTVIDTGVLSNNDDEFVRRFIYRFAKVLGVVEFPHNAFKSADTGVKTAVILLEKTEKELTEDYDIFGALPVNLGYNYKKKNVPPVAENDLGKVLNDWYEYLGLKSPCKKDKKCIWYENKHLCEEWGGVFKNP